LEEAAKEQAEQARNSVARTARNYKVCLIDSSGIEGGGRLSGKTCEAEAGAKAQQPWRLRWIVERAGQEPVQHQGLLRAHSIDEHRANVLSMRFCGELHATDAAPHCATTGSRQHELGGN